MPVFRSGCHSGRRSASRRCAGVGGKSWPRLLRGFDGRGSGGLTCLVVCIRIFVGPHGIRIRGRGSSVTRGQDELSPLVRGGCDEEHVAVGSVEELVENLRGMVRPVVAEDALFCDTACDGDSSELRDIVKDLIQARVIRRDRELMVDVGDLRAIGGRLRRGQVYGFGRCWSGSGERRRRLRWSRHRPDPRGSGLNWCGLGRCGLSWCGLGTQRGCYAEQQGKSNWGPGTHALGLMLRRVWGGKGQLGFVGRWEPDHPAKLRVPRLRPYGPSLGMTFLLETRFRWGRIAPRRATPLRFEMKERWG